MSENPHFYRITSYEDLHFDQEGYLLTHLSKVVKDTLDARSVPMIDTLDDLELIARFLVFNGMSLSSVLSVLEPFLLLQIDKRLVEHSTAKTHHWLGSEHFGRVHKKAISQIFRGEWVPDYSTSLSDKVLQSKHGKKIADFTRGRKPVIQRELTAAEISQLLAEEK